MARWMEFLKIHERLTLLIGCEDLNKLIIDDAKVS
jgi:hypothetical protein